MKYKYDPSNKSPVLAEYSLNPRNRNNPKENPPNSISIFLMEHNSFTLYTDRYDLKTGDWHSLRSIELPFKGEMVSLIPWRQFLLIFGKENQFIRDHKTFCSIERLQKMPTQRFDFTAIEHNDSIYVIGGYEIDTSGQKFKVASAIVEK